MEEHSIVRHGHLYPIVLNNALPLKLRDRDHGRGDTEALDDTLGPGEGLRHDASSRRSRFGLELRQGVEAWVGIGQGEVRERRIQKEVVRVSPGVVINYQKVNHRGILRVLVLN